ncbi:hypothetical protein M3Y94_01095000 [Aphelenchoides besseyi]|nr:hypothetical protein M3Y94_01095000 [Aphelenchoides besseyi]KAI6221669.1 hypothetical protein M3Y95_00986700 [Aphelenchoides besseyi]
MPKRGKCPITRTRRRANRLHKRSEDSSDGEQLGDEIREVFDQMDFIYGELEIVNSDNAYMYDNHDLSDLDSSLDFVYEQIGKWLVGYCGCLVQREQVGRMDVDCLENLLDKLLGICYQLESWAELVDSVLKDLSVVCETNDHSTDVPIRDLDELRRRRQRVQEVQNYVTRIKERHIEHLVTNDHRPFAQLTPQDKETLAFRYGRYLQASFPSTPIQRLQEIIGKVTIDRIPHLLEAYG